MNLRNKVAPSEAFSEIINQISEGRQNKKDYSRKLLGDITASVKLSNKAERAYDIVHEIEAIKRTLMGMGIIVEHDEADDLANKYIKLVRELENRMR